MQKIKRYFLSGLVIFLPLTLTIYALVIVIGFADGILGKFIEPYFYKKFGFYFRGISIIITFFVIVFIGFFVTNFLGRRIYPMFENLLLKLPFFRQVYPAFKEIAMFLFSRDKLAFQQVVMVEYPRKGVYSIGFLTNVSSKKIEDILKQETCNVFVPTAPGPLTGFIILVPKRDVIFTKFTVEETIKFIVSGGVVNI